MSSQFANLGRAARQKRVRRLLRGVSIPTPVHLGAWVECYRHWTVLNEGLNKDSGSGERDNNILSGSSDVCQFPGLLDYC